MSESVEMYLLRIALLQQEGQPVPLAQLAEELAISPISANQMCRRLEERDLVTYQPYKGVTLTAAGERMALTVLRKRRLWEVFLAEKLGLAPQEAETFACRFEHVTPDDLAEALAAFLDHPQFSPQRQPIPPALVPAAPLFLIRLADLPPGASGQVRSLTADRAAADFLAAQGLHIGADFVILASGEDGARLIAAGDRTLALTASLAAAIHILPSESL
ncbi:MAG: metal-dependent transcriptional regulator [Caldilineales bacterium]|nr:metal-dependent transcriptional regulator [Caldilineales bacterium]